MILLLARTVGAQDLPDLGDASQSTLSQAQELMYGKAIMAQIRSSPSYLHDAEVTDYLNQVGYRLVANCPDPGGHFEFFVIKDESINAFALPGGFIGVHSGLLLTAQSESEFLGVIGHEIAHVTQRHLARMMAVQRKTGLASLAAIAVAILAARSSPQLSQGALAAAAAAPLQAQLNYSRDNEREADRIGLQIVQKSDYDVHAVPVFFERLQRASQIYRGGAPSYLRTHPLTFERIADIQNRVSEMPYRQVPDSLAFHLVRARLTALDGSPSGAVVTFRERISHKKYANEVAARYGYVVALLRQDVLEEVDIAAARGQVDTLLEKAPDDPMILALHAQLEMRAEQTQVGLSIYRQALRLYPTRRSLIYGYSAALMNSGRARAAVEFLDRSLDRVAPDPRLYELKAKAHALQGQQLRQHRARAEALLLKGNLSAAIEQLRFAQASDDGDFYERSAVNARLRELIAVDAQLRRDN
ncbi:MAG: M48 family metallopeptidase [Betaproteobacteria bacterium]|nr:MAG: M48 family metallopeptidase [Betaproteobacteria bacterium]